MDYYGSKFKEFDYIKKQLLELNEYFEILNIKKEQLEKWTKLNLIDIPIKESKYINKNIVSDLEKDVEMLVDSL